MRTIKSTLFNLLLLTLLSCNSSKNIGDYWNYNIPNKEFNDSINYYPLDYSKAENWLFYADKNDPVKLLPKNYNAGRTLTRCFCFLYSSNHLV